MKHPIQPLSPKRKENGMRPLVIYHGNCADGFSAAWCFWRKYGTEQLVGFCAKAPLDVTCHTCYNGFAIAVMAKEI